MTNAWINVHAKMVGDGDETSLPILRVFPAVHNVQKSLQTVRLRLAEGVEKRSSKKSNYSDR